MTVPARSPHTCAASDPDEPPPSPRAPAGSNPRAGRLHPAVWLIAGGLIAAGFLGADRWLYEQVGLRLNTPDPLDGDFYELTQPFWGLVRFFPHVIGGLLAYFAIMAFHRRGWRMANAALLAALAAALAANLAQKLIGRLRPDQAVSQWSFAPPLSALRRHVPVSFPSGEAATAFAMAWVLARAFPRLRAAFYVLALLVALSRFLHGQHYLSDVVAGALLGTLLVRRVFALVSKWKPLAGLEPTG